MKYLSSLLIVALLILSFPEPARAEAPTDFISCWDLEEGTGASRIDANTTNSNDLDSVNNVPNAAGLIGNAADFTRSSSQYLQVTNANSTNLAITGSFTISVWIKMDANPPNDASFQLVNRLQADDGYALAVFRTVGGVNQVRRVIKNAATTYFNDVTTTLNTGTWYHLVWTYDATDNNSILYKDTSSISNVTSTVDPAAVSSSFRISSNAETAGQYMDGLIDIVEIYDRELTSAEVTELYNAGAGVACSDRGGAEPEATVYPISTFSGDMTISGDVTITQ